MRQISIGKYRGLQQCSTKNGALSILALDHRNNLRMALEKTGGTISPTVFSQFKLQVTAALAGEGSAVLLDPEFGAAQSVAAGTIPGSVGLLSAVEATGYTGEPTGRESNLLANWSVAKIKRMGASAVKLLIYYHPDSDTAKQNEELIAKVAEDCVEQDIPLVLEPLSFPLDAGTKKVIGDERRRVVLETARRLTQFGIDILKAEFPLDIEHAPGEVEWTEACKELTEASTVPWVLLSASVDFDTYIRQLTIACEQGASGAAVGRAVWKEAVDLTGDERVNFLATTGKQRMEQVTRVCNQSGRAWTEVLTPAPVDETWYSSY